MIDPFQSIDYCNDPVTLHNRIAHINNNQERINYTLVNLSVLSFPPFIFITTTQINIYYYLFIIVTYNQLLYSESQNPFDDLEI